MAPGELRRKFADRLTGAIHYHQELLIAAHGRTRQAALETMLSEQFVLNVVVLWEVFLSDLLICYLALSPDRYLKSLSERVCKSIGDRYGQAAGNLVVFSSPRTVSLQAMRALVDPKQFNITVDSAGRLQERANELLEAKYARLFTLEPENAQFFDFVTAMRNYLAHRSVASRGRLKKAVSALNGVNAGLCAPVSNIGAYLKTRSGGTDTRSIVMARRLIEIANVLA